MQFCKPVALSTEVYTLSYQGDRRNLICGTISGGTISRAMDFDVEFLMLPSTISLLDFILKARVKFNSLGDDRKHNYKKQL